MRRNLRLLLGLVIALAFCVWAVHLLFERWGQVPAMRLGWVPLLSAFALACAVVSVNSSMFEFTARRVGNGLGFWAAQRVGMVSTLFNYFLPLRAGLVWRMLQYVRGAGHDPVHLGAALMAATLVVQVVGVAVLAISLTVLTAVPRGLVYIGLVAGLGLGLLVAGVPHPSGRGLGRLGQAMERVRDGVHALLRQGAWPILAIGLFALAGVVATALRFLAVLAMMPVESSFAVALAMAAGAGLSTLISVTFGGFGVRETAVVLVGAMAGLEPEAALVMALADRVIVSTAVTALGIPVLLHGRQALAWR